MSLNIMLLVFNPNSFLAQQKSNTFKKNFFVLFKVQHFKRSSYGIFGYRYKSCNSWIKSTSQFLFLAVCRTARFCFVSAILIIWYLSKRIVFVVSNFFNLEVFTELFVNFSWHSWLHVASFCDGKEFWSAWEIGMTIRIVDFFLDIKWFWKCRIAILVISKFKLTAIRRIGHLSHIPTRLSNLLSESEICAFDWKGQPLFKHNWKQILFGWSEICRI